MGVFTFVPTMTATPKKESPKCKRKQQKQVKQPSSWDQIKSLLTCKQIEASQVQDPSKNIVVGYTKLGSSCRSICSFRDVVHGNTRVMHRSDNSPESSSLGQETALLSRKPGTGSSTRLLASTRSNNGGTYSSSSSSSASSRGMHLRKLSGCYECHTIIDPSRTTICACPQCGEVFPKIESLDLHQAVKHAVMELGPDDSGRNIVEIIFKSSWLKIDNPICKIERILKVHNSQRTIQRFEDCRDAVKARVTSNVKKNPRCAADGNELLRFHCTTLSCALGARGSSTLCGYIPGCGVCTIIRQGFSGKAHDGKGVHTTASSGRAHDSLMVGSAEGRRAMLVCRVIAGRVKRIAEEAPPEEESGSTTGMYDSVAGIARAYTNLEELFVFNPRAILPCFVVIYKALD
ncbi:uncharacterized protein LOC122091126 isoform X2 [Macadamia integrifolia]|uniref:uncharacterized protein LOC122091126 isoform X2 n=1 Tax=Macadamia integrifolia TaxID=60698 RepID=UPI001C4F3575|nr:uncharacterized protein LOC122091126 isoform X2 [Macadamia integrifolia]